MPEPTKTPSAPSCIIIAASAGVAMPPAVNSTTGQLAGRGDLLDQVVRRLQLLGRDVQLVLARGRASRRISRADRAHVGDGVGDVAGAGLALGADHRRALGDPAQRLAEVGRAAHERAR